MAFRSDAEAVGGPDGGAPQESPEVRPAVA